MQHWTITRDADGLATLTFDKAGATANTLSAAVLAELNDALDILDREPPKGLIIRSGKANGFIAGADVDEFGDVKDDAGAHRDRQARLGHVRAACARHVSDTGAGARLLPGRRPRAGARVPLSRRRRRARARGSGLPEVMLGIVPGWGGIKRLPRLAGAPAALDLLLTGKTIDARRAKKLGVADECVPVRIMENTARGVLRALPPPRTLPLPLSLTLNPLARRFIAAQAEKQVAKRARREHYPAPYAILDLWVKYDGNALAAPPSDPASIPSLLRSPTAANLIRVFRLQERLKGLGKEGDLQGGARARRRRRHDGRRHRRVVRVARPDRHAAGPERASGWRRRCSAPASSSPTGCAIRAACATRRDRLIPDVAGDGVARADVIIEAIFENVDAKRALFAALEKKAKPDGDPRDQHVEHSARGHRAPRWPIRRASSACTSSIRWRG